MGFTKQTNLSWSLPYPPYLLLPSLTTAHLRKTMASEKIQKIKQR